jgi:uncharacterized protein YjdB
LNPQIGRVTCTVASVPVFVGNYTAGAAFAPFGGSVNDVTVDATNSNNGRASLKVVNPGTSYTGGAVVLTTGVDLRPYNVLTFWAKASAAVSINNVGFGDTADASSGPQTAEFHTTNVGTAWQKYTFPIPRPAALTSARGLFFFAGIMGAAGATVWFNDVQFEALDSAAYASAVGAVTNVNVNWPTPTVAIGSTFQLDFNPNTVFYTTPTAYRVGWNYFTLSSSNAAVATVDSNGLITGVDAGTAIISAGPFGGFTVPGSATVTVPSATTPMAPTTAAMTPKAMLRPYIRSGIGPIS